MNHCLIFENLLKKDTSLLFLIIYLPGWVSIERPAFVQYIIGTGCPSAWQLSVIGLLTIPMASLLSTLTIGGTNIKNKKNVKRKNKVML